MTVTAVGQVEFNGLRLDGDYEIQMIEGLRGMPEVRSSDVPILGRHGLFLGGNWLGGRIITIVVAVVPSDPTTFDVAMEALAAAFSLSQTEAPLTCWVRGLGAGEAVRLYARPRKFDAPMDTAYNQGVAIVAIQLSCTDPLIYGDTEQTASTTLTETTAGLEWSLDWALDWGGASTAGSIIAENRGNFEAPVVLRIDGPVTNPRIENLTVGRTIELGITLLTGEFIEIDTAAHTVMLGGTASRYSTITDDSQWWNLAPGVNTLNFHASTPDAALLTATWRSAWA